jgi:CMP-N,N'-diacetyllegionaminic acid synthase
MIGDAEGGVPTVWALIPARGGSKGITRKNMALLRGRPLIEYTIDAALQAPSIQRTVVSSDDPEILDLARARGVVAIERPAAYATDMASADSVVKHFLAGLTPQERDKNPTVVYLQPTSPLRTADDIERAFFAMNAANATSLVSVVPTMQTPFKMFTLSEAGLLQSLFDERLSNARRQDLLPTFLPNGAIYIFALSQFLARDGFPSNGSVAFVMDPLHSVDIDEPSDIELAERILKRNYA